MNLKSKVLVGTILLLCSMSMLAGCLEESSIDRTSVKVSIFVGGADWISPGSLYFEEAGWKKATASFWTGVPRGPQGRPNYLRFFKLNKTITPPWIEVIGLPKIIESTENEYRNTTEVQFTVIMTERPQTDSGVVYIIYDWYLW